MRAVDRLFWAYCGFDDSWRAHAASMQAATILGFSRSLSPNFAAAIQLAKGFDPEFDNEAALEDLFEELDYLKAENYEALRVNCLLGLCASFESFGKTFIAALGYEPNWNTPTSSVPVLTMDTSVDFAQRFSEVDRRWRSKPYYLELLKKEFPWVDSALIDTVGDVFWLRNQVAHNAKKAAKDRALNEFAISYSEGQSVEIDKKLLGKCVTVLRACVKQIAEPTPYREAVW